jgi:Ca-activated chloride channel homolog
MNLLGPLSSSVWLYAAGGTAVLTLLAYIIKMRRRRFEVPFAKLWERVLDQKDSNSLWKQLKRLLSLLLMLLIVGLLLFAALDPTLGGANRDARSVVVIIDASASMKTADGSNASDLKQPTRFDIAKQKAKALVDSMGGGDVAMILRVDGQATPLSRFSNDAPMLRNVVDKLQASDTPADMPRAFAAAADALVGRTKPLIVLISDGAFPQSQLTQVKWNETTDAPSAPAVVPALAAVNQTDLSGIDIRFLPVGRRSDNVGIVAFNVRRYVANKAAYEVFIEVQNFGSAPVNRQLTLWNGTTAVEVRDLALAPGQRLRQVYRELPGGDDNRLRATLKASADDPFALDDEAYALLPARKKQKVLLVTTDNLYLEGAILVYDNIATDKITPDEYTANPAIAADYATVIFDEFTPVVIPPPPTALMFFHPTGTGSPIAVTREAAKPRITDIDENHPVLRWVTLSDVNFDSSAVFSPDSTKGEFTLASSVRDPIIAGKRSAGQKMLLFGFSLPAPGRAAATDLPLRVAFPLLLVNALDWFSGDDADLLTTYVTGKTQRVVLDTALGTTALAMTAPDGRSLAMPILDGAASFYAPLVGFYQLRGTTTADAGQPQQELAANLANAAESNIAPSTDMSIAGKTLSAPEAFAVSHSQKLWLYILLIVAFLVGLEWFTYHRRITV